MKEWEFFLLERHPPPLTQVWEPLVQKTKKKFWKYWNFIGISAWFKGYAWARRAPRLLVSNIFNSRQADGLQALNVPPKKDLWQLAVSPIPSPGKQRGLIFIIVIFDDSGNISYKISHQRHLRHQRHRHHRQYHCSSASHQHQHHIIISIIVKRFISSQHRRAPAKRRQKSSPANTKRWG